MTGPMETAIGAGVAAGMFGGYWIGRWHKAWQLWRHEVGKVRRDFQHVRSGPRW